MSYISPEGIVIPAGTDNWNLTTDLRAQAASTRSVVPVADRATGDSVVTAMNTDGRTAGSTNPLVIFNAAKRLLEINDSTGWITQTIVKAAIGTSNQAAGTALTAAMGTNVANGTTALTIQCGSYVGTSDANGYIGITYPQPFLQTVIMVLAMSGDSGSGPVVMTAAGSVFPQTVSTLYLRAYTANTGVAVNGAQLRWNWLAVGI